MKLLHVSPYALQDPSLGGVPQAVKSISNALYQSGHEVTIWASDVGESTPGISRENDVGVQTRLFHARLRLLGRAINSPLVPRLMLLDPSMIEEFDLVHLHGYWNSFTPSVTLACMKAGIPLILQPHGALVDSGQREFAKRTFQFLFRRRIVAVTRAVVVLSDDEKAEVERAGFRSGLINIVPNPLPTPEMTLPAAGDARSQLGLHIGAMIILYLGRLHPAKGLRELVAAYSMVRRAVPTATLVIAGPDEGMRSELVKQVHDTRLEGVVFLGALTGRRKWLALRAADVVCLPSRFEAFPMTVLEAAVIGTPFVVSNTVGLTGLTEGISYIAASASPEPLAQCLIQLLNDDELRRGLCTNARAEVHRNFNPTKFAARLGEVYRRAVD